MILFKLKIHFLAVCFVAVFGVMLSMLTSCSINKTEYQQARLAPELEMPPEIQLLSNPKAMPIPAKTGIIKEYFAYLNMPPLVLSTPQNSQSLKASTKVVASLHTNLDQQPILRLDGSFAAATKKLISSVNSLALGYIPENTLELKYSLYGKQHLSLHTSSAATYVVVKIAANEYASPELAFKLLNAIAQDINYTGVKIKELGALK